MKSTALKSFLFFMKILIIGANYRSAYIEDLCHPDKLGVWDIGSASSNSSGFLKASKSGNFLSGRNCTFIIQPPLGYGVILSVRLLDFRPFYPQNCQSYIEITEESKPIKLCGYSQDLAEYQSYHTEGKAMKLSFVTVNKTGSEFYSNVFFVATSYLTLSYSCELKMFKCGNSRCIWKGLTCDGHNNCGDQSDELSHRRANCGVISPGIIVGIIVGSVIFFILLIIVPLACYRYIKNKNIEDEPPLTQPSPPPYRASTSGECSQRSEDLPPSYKP